MKKMAFILLITCLLLVSCQPSDQPDHTETYTNVILDGQDITDVLKEGMHYDELCARIGKEDRDVGSGIIIGEWDLDDALYSEYILCPVQWPLLEDVEITANQADAIADAFADFIWEEVSNEN